MAGRLLQHGLQALEAIAKLAATDKLAGGAKVALDRKPGVCVPSSPFASLASRSIWGLFLKSASGRCEACQGQGVQGLAARLTQFSAQPTLLIVNLSCQLIS